MSEEDIVLAWQPQLLTLAMTLTTASFRENVAVGFIKMSKYSKSRL